MHAPARQTKPELSTEAVRFNELANRIGILLYRLAPERPEQVQWLRENLLIVTSDPRHATNANGIDEERKEVLRKCTLLMIAQLAKFAGKESDEAHDLLRAIAHY